MASTPGFVAERLIAPVLKTDVGKPTVSSNLTKPATLLMERWLSDGQHLPAKKAFGRFSESLVRIQHVPPASFPSGQEGRHTSRLNISRYVCRNTTGSTVSGAATIRRKRYAMTDGAGADPMHSTRPVEVICCAGANGQAVNPLKPNGSAAVF